MEKVIFRFYEEINDFLPVKDKKRDIIVTIQDKVSVREIIRRFGVPLDEVDLILVNGESVDPAYLLDNDDRVSVYPVFESFDIGSISRVRSTPLRKTAFLLPANLKSLAEALKNRGHDVTIVSGATETDLARYTDREKRILITSDKTLYQKVSISRILYVPPGSVKMQVQFIVNRLHLKKHY
jgi:hypothetical protein